MFGFFTSIFWWLFSSVFDVSFYFAENIIEWILPIYMTIYVLHNQQHLKYNNYICFWCLASFLYLMDCLTIFGLHNIFLYRIFRFIFLLWIQIDYCHNSVTLIQYVAPVIDQHRESMDQTLNKIGSQVDSTYSTVMNNAKTRISEFIRDSGDNVLKGVANAAGMVSSSMKQPTSAGNNNDPTLKQKTVE